MAVKQSKSEDNEIQKGDLISVPLGNQFLQGIVTEFDKDTIVLENYGAGKVKVPNNDHVYKFRPGQKFDYRELYSIDTSSESGISIMEKLDKFLSKTDVGSFKALQEKDKKQISLLLSGSLTSRVFKGASLVNAKPGEPKVLKNWEAKFQLYRKNKVLKLDAKFKQAKAITKLYGVELTPEQLKAVMEKNQKIVLDRTTNTGRDFKVFAQYDKELNTIVTTPYSKKIEELLKKSYAKKENAAKKTTEGTTAKQSKPTVTKSAPKVAPKKKGKGI